jgi:hypothetical protein
VTVAGGKVVMTFLTGTWSRLADGRGRVAQTRQPPESLVRVGMTDRQLLREGKRGYALSLIGGD